jgi:hypothetical protein
MKKGLILDPNQLVGYEVGELFEACRRRPGEGGRPP